MIGFILAHLLGDYVFQSSWMANKKTSTWWIAVLHALIYTAVYEVWMVIAYRDVAFLPWISAALIIYITHAVIDGHRVIVARMIWALNQLVPKGHRYPFHVAIQGYPPETPDWLRGWLAIIVDNSVHLTINAIAITALLGGIK